MGGSYVVADPFILSQITFPLLFLYICLKQYYSPTDGKYKNKFSHNLTTLTQMLLSESLSMWTL